MNATHVVIFTTSDGRVSHGLTSDPVRLLAMRVADGLMSAKQAAATEVYAVTLAPLDKAALTAEIEFQRLVVVAMSNPDPIRKAVLEGRMSPEQLERLRAELTRRAFDEDVYASPWPFREERDVSPDEDAP